MFEITKNSVVDNHQFHYFFFPYTFITDNKEDFNVLTKILEV